LTRPAHLCHQVERGEEEGDQALKEVTIQLQCTNELVREAEARQMNSVHCTKLQPSLGARILLLQSDRKAEIIIAIYQAALQLPETGAQFPTFHISSLTMKTTLRIQSEAVAHLPL
jgi:hypothetical protein